MLRLAFTHLWSVGFIECIPAVFQISVRLRAGQLRYLWSWMKRSDHEGFMSANTLHYMLMLISEMVNPTAPGFRRNTLRLGMDDTHCALSIPRRAYRLV